MGRFESGHLPTAHLKPSHHLPGSSRILSLRENPDLAEKNPLAAGAGSGLDILPGIKMAAAAAPEDDEHEKRRDFRLQAAAWH